MLNSIKRESILQWFNSLTTKGDVRSLSQFADGCDFYEIVQSIYADLQINQEDEKSNSGGNLVQSESATEKDPVSDVQKKFSLIQKFIDDFFHLESETLINFQDCMDGKELELAKVSVILLSALVQKFLSEKNPLLDTTAHLETQVQEEIKECMSLFLERAPGDGQLKKTEFQKILGRHAKVKESHRTRASAYATPDRDDSGDSSSSRGRKRKDRSFVLQSEVLPSSPVKNYLESPNILHKAALFRKDTDLRKLRNTLFVEENKSADLAAQLVSLHKGSEQKKIEFEKLKGELQTLQNMLDEIKTNKETESLELVEEKQRNVNNFQQLKEEIKNLKTENEDLQNSIAGLEEKLSKKEKSQVVDPLVRETGEKLVEMELLLRSKDELLDEMKEKTNSLENQLQHYKQMWQEAKDAVKVIPSVPSSPVVEENVKMMVSEDDQSLLEKIKEIESLQEKLLDVAQKKQEFKRETSNEVEKHRLRYNQNITLLRQELAKMADERVTQRKKWGRNDYRCKTCRKVFDSAVLKSSSQTALDSTTKESLSDKGPDSVGSLWSTFNNESEPNQSVTKLNLIEEPLLYSGYECTQDEFNQIRTFIQDIVRVIKDTYDETEDLKKLVEAQDVQSLTDVVTMFQSLASTLKGYKSQVLLYNPAATDKRRKQSTLEDNKDIVKLKNVIRVLESEREKLKRDVVETKKTLLSKLDILEKELKDLQEKYQKSIQFKNIATEKYKKLDKIASNFEAKLESLKHVNEVISIEKEECLKLSEELKAQLDEKTAKAKQCGDCEKLRKKALELKKDRNNFEREVKDIQFSINELRVRNTCLERQLKEEAKERKRLEFKIKTEDVIRRGSLAEKKEIIDACLKNMPKSSQTKFGVKKPEKTKVVSRTHSYVLHKVGKEACNESITSVNFPNKSIRSSLFQGEDEEDFLNHSSLAEIHAPELLPEERLREIQRRNTLCLPHLQSSYPLEIQNMTPNERKYYAGQQMSFESTAERAYWQKAEEDRFGPKDCDDNDSYFHTKKPKFSDEDDKLSAFIAPIVPDNAPKKQASNMFGKLTPKRKAGSISVNRTFKSPSGNSLLKRMSQKSKKQ